MKKYDVAVFIGRFAPFHLGHAEILKESLSLADKVVVLLGSSNQARNIKNPWTAAERAEMIYSTLSADDRERVKIVPIRDYLYNENQWIAQIQHKVVEAIYDNEQPEVDPRVVLVGFKSDSSSYYLNLFPQWDYKEADVDFPYHATKVREYLFSMDNAYKGIVPPAVASYLENFQKTPIFAELKKENEFIDNYKNQWVGAPFPPTFFACDSVVIKSGHILLVRRKGYPGKGLMALPGGFLNQKEDILTGALRELKEETSIALSKDELKKHIEAEKIFDAPGRSLRGRLLSYAYLINLGSGPLPKVKGGDDAAKSFWLPLNEVREREDQFFDDHFHIINYFVNKF